MEDRAAVRVPAGSRLALVCLVALVVLSPWPFGSVPLRTTEALAVAALLVALVAVALDTWRGELQWPSPVVLWPLVALWALALFQLAPLPETLHRFVAPGSAQVWHPAVPAAADVLGRGPHPISLDPHATRRWLAFTTGLVALALAAAPALRSRRILLRATIALVIGGFAVAAYGLVARLVFGNKLYGVWSVPTVAPFGPFVSKNHFAGYVELAALLAVGLAAGLADEAHREPGWLGWIESRRAKWVVTAGGAALVLVLAVAASLSRGGVVSLTAGLLVFALLRLAAHKPGRLSARTIAAGLGVLLLAATAVAAVLPTEARDRMLSLTGIATEHSGAYRLGVWRDTLRLVASSPGVGSGFGAFADALPRFKTAAAELRVEHAESDVLELLAEGGLLAGLLVVLGLGLFVGPSLRRGEGDTGRLARALSAAALAAVATVLVHSAFDFNLRIPSNALIAAMATTVAGLGLSLEGAVRTRRTGVVVLALLLTTGVVAFSANWHPTPPPREALRRVSPSAETPLRRMALEAETVAHLSQRPADAPAWLALAWLRRPRAVEEAKALASWAAALAPNDEALRRAAEGR